MKLTAKRKRNAKALASAPKLATCRFVRRLDHIVACYKPGGLQRFVNFTSMSAHGILDSVRTGHDINMERFLAFGAQPAPECVSWATDEEQTQLTGGGYIIDELSVTGVRFNDFFHRVCNDLDAAQARLLALHSLRAPRAQRRACLLHNVSRRRALCCAHP